MYIIFNKLVDNKAENALRIKDYRVSKLKQKMIILGIGFYRTSNYVYQSGLHFKYRCIYIYIHTCILLYIIWSYAYKDTSKDPRRVLKTFKTKEIDYHESGPSLCNNLFNIFEVIIILWKTCKQRRQQWVVCIRYVWFLYYITIRWFEHLLHTNWN